jgi:hypothetical protein
MPETKTEIDRNFIISDAHTWFLKEYRGGKFSYLLESKDENEYFDSTYHCGDDFLCSFINSVKSETGRNFEFSPVQVDFLKEHCDGKFSYLLEIEDIFQFKKALDDTQDNLLRRFLYATGWQDYENHKSPLEQKPTYTGYVCVTTDQAFFLRFYQNGEYLYLLEIDNVSDFMKAMEEIHSYGDIDLRRYLNLLCYLDEKIHSNVSDRFRAISEERLKRIRETTDEVKVEIRALEENLKSPLYRDETHAWFLKEYRGGKFSHLLAIEDRIDFTLAVKDRFDIKDNFLRSFLYALSWQPLETQSDEIAPNRINTTRKFHLSSGQVWVLNEYRSGTFAYLLAIDDKAEFLKALDDTKETFLGRLLYALAWQPMETPGTAPDNVPPTGEARNFFLNGGHIRFLEGFGYSHLLEIKDGADFRKALEDTKNHYLCRSLYAMSWQPMDTTETLKRRMHEVRQEVLSETDESRLKATIDRNSSPYLN